MLLNHRGLHLNRTGASEGGRLCDPNVSYSRLVCGLLLILRGRNSSKMFGVGMCLSDEGVGWL